MKYRIEDGEVKMPISELNRINDAAEKLSLLKGAFELERERYERGLVKREFYSFDGYGIKTDWKGTEKEVEKLEYLTDQIVKKTVELNNLKNILDGMSILQFIRFRKNLSGNEKP